MSEATKGLAVMGRYSSSDEDSSRRQKKKKKRRSRSRSRSASSVDSRYSSSKHKKSKRKHKHRSRSRSRSADRYSRGDRSASRRQRSRSRSRGRRSRSPARRRSRSYDRGRRSPSPYSRSRRSRSDSRGRYHKRSTSRDRVSRRSTSRDRPSRRSSSRSRSVSRRSSPEKKKLSPEGDSSSTTRSTTRADLSALENVPCFSDMTPAEQAQARLKLALKAATMTDEKLKEQGESSNSRSSPQLMSRQEFSDAVASIEADSFVPSAFKSSRSSRDNQKDVGISHPSHDLAMFGAVGSSVIFTKTEPLDRSALDNDPESIMDPSLNVDPEEKMKRWIQKLAAMRRKKLEGDSMTY